MLTALFLSDEGPRELDLFDLWRRIHGKGELVKWELGRELVRRHAPELEVLTFEARLPGPHREVLWAPALARIRSLERVCVDLSGYSTPIFCC